MSTIIVHGTFDPEGSWWRNQQTGSFLDGVAKGMREGLVEPDIWQIGGRSVRDFPELRPKGGWTLWSGRKHAAFLQVDGHFRWTGANLHDAGRLSAAEELARYLKLLSTVEPAEKIHLIAHSHGCNVVKQATQILSSQVNLGRLVFLAAPHFVEMGSHAPLYSLNVDRLTASSPTVLNVYSPDDSVQVGLADLMPDLGLPPGMPGLAALGFAGTPVVQAFREDSDPKTASIYENLEIPTEFGSGFFAGIEAHSAMHSPIIGRLVGLWLARWPEVSGQDCLRHVGHDE